MNKRALTVWMMWRNSLNENDESELCSGRRQSPRGVGGNVDTKTARHLKRETTSRLWGTVEISGDSRDTEIPRGSGGVEIENEM